MKSTYDNIREILAPHMDAADIDNIMQEVGRCSRVQGNEFAALAELKNQFAKLEAKASINCEPMLQEKARYILSQLNTLKSAPSPAAAEQSDDALANIRAIIKKHNAKIDSLVTKDGKSVFSDEEVQEMKLKEPVGSITELQNNPPNNRIRAGLIQRPEVYRAIANVKESGLQVSVAGIPDSVRGHVVSTPQHKGKLELIVNL